MRTFVISILDLFFYRFMFLCNHLHIHNGYLRFFARYLKLAEEIVHAKAKVYSHKRYFDNLHIIICYEINLFTFAFALLIKQYLCMIEILPYFFFFLSEHLFFSKNYVSFPYSRIYLTLDFKYSSERVVDNYQWLHVIYM